MKKISFAEIDKVIKNAALPKTTMFQLDAGDEQIEVEVKTSLSLRERTDMAFEIADMIFPEDADAVYMPTFEQSQLRSLRMQTTSCVFGSSVRCTPRRYLTSSDSCSP